MILKDKVAVITGAASGLGLACAKDFLGKGAKIAIFDFAADRGEAVAAELGKSVIFAHTDVTSEESVQAAIKKTMDTFGTIDININCAGAGDAIKVNSKKGPYPLNTFARTLTLNVVGTFNVLRLAIEQMMKNTPNEDGEKGVIINTASVAAFDGQIGQAAYSASKGGVVSMTLPIARECASYGIRVMTIAPGVFKTPILAGLSDEALKSLESTIPFPSRLGKPEEFALMARNIIENPYINGEVIRLDAAIRMAAK
jgi:NAD(P)-dependent dehydrogenase (short-subunit alcohol dehydrogenase family)